MRLLELLDVLVTSVAGFTLAVITAPAQAAAMRRDQPET